VRTLRGDWLYIVVPRAQTLVRVGTASQPPEELEEKAAAILGQEPSPPSPPPPPPPLPQSPAPLAQPEPLAVAPLPEPGPPVLRNRLSVSVLGGRQAYYFSSCSGGTSGLLDFGNVAVQYEHEGTLGASTSGVTLVRARGLAGSDPSGFTGGTALTGLYEFRWKHVSLGVGLTFSVLSSFSNSVLPQSLYFAPGYPSPTGLALGVMPLLYLRFEALMGFAFELGTGSIFQPQDGVFAGFRWGFDEAGKVAVRAGVESTWLPHPLSNTNLFTDVGIPLGTRHRLHFRLMGHPWNAPAISGGLRWSFQF
jgi:hypothetical protein